MNYLNKYLKYKNKYLNLKNKIEKDNKELIGGNSIFLNILPQQINRYQNQLNINQPFYSNLVNQTYPDIYPDLFGKKYDANYSNLLEFAYVEKYKQTISYQPTFISTTFSFLEKFDLPKELKKTVIDDLYNINGPKYYIIDWANLIYTECNGDVILKIIEWLEYGNYVIISSKNTSFYNILDVINFYDLLIVNKLGYYIQIERLIIIQYHTQNISTSSIDDAVFWLITLSIYIAMLNIYNYYNNDSSNIYDRLILISNDSQNFKKFIFDGSYNISNKLKNGTGDSFLQIKLNFVPDIIRYNDPNIINNGYKEYKGNKYNWFYFDESLDSIIIDAILNQLYNTNHFIGIINGFNTFTNENELWSHYTLGHRVNTIILESLIEEKYKQLKYNTSSFNQSDPFKTYENYIWVMFNPNEKMRKFCMEAVNINDLYYSSIENNIKNYDYGKFKFNQNNIDKSIYYFTLIKIFSFLICDNKIEGMLKPYIDYSSFSNVGVILNNPYNNCLSQIYNNINRACNNSGCNCNINLLYK